MSSPAIRLEAKPGKRTDGFVEYRATLLPRATDSFAASVVRDARGQSGHFAGHQFKVVTTHTLVPDRVKLAMGTVYLAKGCLLSEAPNAPSSGDTVYGFTDDTFSF